MRLHHLLLVSIIFLGTAASASGGVLPEQNDAFPELTQELDALQFGRYVYIDSSDVSYPELAAKRESVDLNGKYFKGYFSDFKNIVTSPKRWTRRDKKNLLMVSGMTAILLATDDRTFRRVQDGRSPSSDKTAHNAELWGAEYPMYLMSAWYVYGKLTDSHRARRVSLLSIESYLMANVFTASIKFVAGRKRPRDGGDHNDFMGPGSGFSSFPSGHSTRAWAVSTVIATEFQDKPLVPIIAYSLATATSWSRVNDEKHWLSDVFVGAAIGFFTAKAIMRYHTADDEYSTRKINRIRAIPVVGDDEIGIGIHFRF